MHSVCAFSHSCSKRLFFFILFLHLSIKSPARNFHKARVCSRQINGFNKCYFVPSAINFQILLSEKCRRHAVLFRLALDFRLKEFDSAVAAVREGMSKVLPVPLLSLFTGYELEMMVCGSPDIPLHLLKSVATYKGKL